VQVRPIPEKIILLKENMYIDIKKYLNKFLHMEIRFHTESAYTADYQNDRIRDYLRKCDIIKQIMSLKARRYRNINASQNIATVIISSSLLFIGFSGPEKINKYISWIHPATIDVTDFIFNSLIFLIFVVGILHLVFRFPEKQSNAEKAISALAGLGNEIEDIATSLGGVGSRVDAAEINNIRIRYESIVQSIPPNSDREFFKAKKAYEKKEMRRLRPIIRPQDLFDSSCHEIIVANAVFSNPLVVDILLSLREYDNSMYLGGGLIRNSVWDFLHGYSSPTPIDDADIVYFDPVKATKQTDTEKEIALSERIPNVRWSVKNQARMHIPNGDSAYRSLEDAISK
jgi:hypothetical protein